MKRTVSLLVALCLVLPATADAAGVRVRPALFDQDPATLPARLPAERPGVALVAGAEWRPLGACLLANQAAPAPIDFETATLRCARVQVLALQQARSEGVLLSDQGARWVQWHKTGQLGEVLRATLAPEVAEAG